MFWYETTVLMVDATLRDYENRNSKRIVSQLQSSLVNPASSVHMPKSWDSKAAGLTRQIV